MSMRNVISENRTLDCLPAEGGTAPRLLIIEAGRVGSNYWRDLWFYRELLYLLAWRDLAVRYKQTVIGIAWVILRPAITMLVFLAFRRMVGTAHSSAPDVLFVFSAVLAWQFFSSSMSESAGSLINDANLIAKVYFPRILLPMAAVVTALADLAISFGLLLFLMLVYGFFPGSQVVWLPAFALLAFAFALGCGLLLSALNVRYRDFRYVVPFITQLGLFVSPIAFSLAEVPAKWRLLVSINPMVGIIEGFRWCLLKGEPSLDPLTTVISTLVTIGMFLIGLKYFRGTERLFADYI